MITDDFPGTLEEFQERFCDEQACRDYIVGVRWPEGWACPKCQKLGEPWRLRQRDIMVCPACEYHCSIKVGTVFEQSKMPLRKWFLALFHVSNSKQGVSAMELKRLLGLGSYETAWTWLHKIREFMKPDADDPPLGPDVELDDTAIGGFLEDDGTTKRGRGSRNKVKVLAAAERGKGQKWRARFRVVENTKQPTVKKFVHDFVADEAFVICDSASSYFPLAHLGHAMHPVVVSKDGSALPGRDRRKLSVAHLPRIHLVFVKVKALLQGTFQNSFTKKHMQKYLDEYAFRFDRRDSKTPGFMFQELAQRIVEEPCNPKWVIFGRIAPNQRLEPDPLSPFFVVLGERLVKRRAV